jgi:uroporphyrin-III C-methyltransferase
MKNPVMGRVTLVGAGPGDPDLLTLRALKAISEADVVVHDRLVSREIMALVPDATRRIDVGKMPKSHRLSQHAINELLVSLALQGLNVARLKGGDPLIFGRGSEEAQALCDAGLPVCYVPGITAAQGAAASTGVPLTHRGLATSVRYVTGHRARDAELDLDWASLASPETTLVVYMGAANIGEIASKLMAHGLSPRTPVLAVAGATTPGEQRMVAALQDVGTAAATQALEPPVLFIIGRVASLYRPASGPVRHDDIIARMMKAGADA